MSSADVAGGVGALRDALEKLQQTWNEASQEWRDGNSRSFEENHLRPLASEVRGAYSVIQRLAETLKQAEKDCEPW